MPIARLSHGNTKKETKPYIRTVLSVLNNLKVNLRHMTPREAVGRCYCDTGGIVNMNTCSEAARNREIRHTT